MTMRFTFSTAAQVLFGVGSSTEVAPHAKQLGQRALVVTGASPSRAESVIEALRALGVAVTRFGVVGEPSVATLEHGVAQARLAECDVVIGLGGGSAVDAAKAIAALATNEGPILDYLEVVGLGKPLAVAPLPCLAVPTTAGTGAEVTHNAVVSVPSRRVKVSLRHPRMAPRLAVIDPRLALSLPPRVTAATGLDALTQCIEPWVSNKANPLTDGFCREGIQRAAKGLPTAIEQGSNEEARADMALCAWLSGLALSNAKLGVVHGIAGPLGGMCQAPHGEICARLLAPAMSLNCRALRHRQPGSPVLARYDEIGRWLTGRTEATVRDAVAWVERVVAQASIPRLGAMGLRAAEIPDLIAKSQRSSSMQGNPISLTDAELEELIAQAL